MNNIRKVLSELSMISDEDECRQRLSSLTNHNIAVISSDLPLNEFNCFEYALELHKLNEYRNIKLKLTSSFFGSVFCNSWFIRWLIERSYIKKGNSNNNLILYQNLRNDFLHAASVENQEMVNSKWGTGCIYYHSILEVPEEYGTMPISYMKPKPDQVWLYFQKYLIELSEIINTLKK